MPSTVQPAILLQYNPVDTWTGTAQNNYLGPQTVAGQRGVLPTFNDSNSYFVASTGSDSNAGDSGHPLASLHKVFDTVGTINSTSGQLYDASGNGKNLTTSGGFNVPMLAWPSYPAPAQGNYAAGPFAATSYFSGTGSDFQSKANYTFEAYVFVLPSISGEQDLFQTAYLGTNGNRMYVINYGTGFLFEWYGNGPTQMYTTQVFNYSTWYHVAFVNSNGSGSLAAGRYIFVNGIQQAITGTNTAYTTPANNNGIYYGCGGGGALANGYMDRVVVSTTQARSSFPTAWGASGTYAWYNFESTPLALASGFHNSVILDSANYNEREWMNLPDDLPGGWGIYSADGKAPTLQIIKGAIPGTYGARPQGRTVQWAGSGTEYYVAETGSNSNNGLSVGAPFLTVQHALTVIGSTSDCCVTILDNGIYQGDLITTATLLTIQAAFGMMPILLNLSNISTAVQISASNSNSTINLYGVTIKNQGSGYLFGNAFGLTGLTVTLTDSTTNGNSLLGQLCSHINFTLVGLNASLVETIVSPDTAGTLQLTNCFISATAANVYYGITAGDSYIKHSTIVNTIFNVILSNDGTLFTVQGCYFNNSPLFVSSVNISGTCYAWVKDCYGYQSNFQIQFSSVTAMVAAFENCLSVNGTDTNGSFNTTTGYAGVGRYAYAFINCVALESKGNGFGNGNPAGAMQLSGAFINCVAMNCSGGVGFSVSGSSIIGLGLISKGNATAFSGFTPISPYSSSTSSVISSGVGSENVNLQPNDAGIFAGNPNSNLNMGINSGLIQANFPLTVNGLYLTTANQNMEGGIVQLDAPLQSTLPIFTASFCGFSGPLGGGLQALYGVMNNCTASLLGAEGIQANYGAVTYSTFASCQGAAITQLQNLTVSNVTAYGCLYGIWAQTGNSIGAANSIFSGSGTYDISSDAVFYYCCAPTLDPNRNNTLDSHSTQLDPLLRNPLGGDLRIQAIAASTPASNPPVNYYFDSPAKLAGSDGFDMGAFQFTYGTLAETWTTINLGATGSDGLLYRNPDHLQRAWEPIHHAEFTREDKSTEENQVGFVLHYLFSWDAVNPMSADQVTALGLMYSNASPRVQIDFSGTGSNYSEFALLKTKQLEWEEIKGIGYSMSGVPTPIKDLEFRAKS